MLSDRTPASLILYTMRLNTPLVNWGDSVNSSNLLLYMLCEYNETNDANMIR